MSSLYSGYYFYPSKYSPPLGHPQVDVYLMSEPSERFFDAHKVIFPAAESDGFRELTITHPWEDWMGSEVERICAGRFKLIDSNKVSHYGFSLGGNLRIQNLDAYTLCSMSSSAPIFNLIMDGNQSAEDLLVNEIEVLIAERKAAWGTNEAGFAKRMSEIEPLTFFLAALVTLEGEIQEIPLETREHGFHGISEIIRETVTIMKEAGDWPLDIPAISNLI
jgi:hypothetical protein